MEPTQSTTKKFLPVIVIIFAIAIVLFLFLLLANKVQNKTEEPANEVTSSSNEEKNESDGKSILSGLLEKKVTTNKESLLSRLLGKNEEENQENDATVQPVDLYYIVETGESASIAYFYISSVSTPIQGIQMVVAYPENVTPTSIESSIRFPDLIKNEINTENRTIFAMASIGATGEAVTGAYPIFTVIFNGENPNFIIDTEKTIVAAYGKSIPFTVISAPK